MMRILLHLVFMFGLSSFLVAQSTTEVPTTLKSPKKSVQQKLDYFLSIADTVRIKRNAPGAGLAIVYEGKVLHTGGIGYRDVEQKLPVTENTLFAIGSTSKAFSGVLAGKLVEKEKMDWKDPISKHLPEFKLKEEYVTRHANFEDAFMHMTGLGRHDTLWYEKQRTPQQLLAGMADLEFHGSFRSEFNYNNLMYMTIGLALERIDGRSWHDQIREEVFNPLGMTSSFTDYKGFMNYTERSIGYRSDGVTTVPHLNIDHVASAGSITSTPKDISKWLAAFVNKGETSSGRFITEETFEYLTSPKGGSYSPPCTLRYYAIGWGGMYIDGKRDIGHAGAINGQEALVKIMPEDGFGIFILTNHESNVKYLLADYATDIFVRDNYERKMEEEEQLEVDRISAFYSDELTEIFTKNEMKNAIKKYRALLKKEPKANFEGVLNSIGYREFLNNNDYEKAIEIFKLNVEEHPESANVYDSLGEAYLNAKKYRLAKQNYQKALELAPNSSHAKAMLAKVEEEMQQ